jgi:hypothetical protein
MDIDRAFIAIPIGTPYAFEKLVPRQGKTDVPGQEGEEIELAGGQRDNLSTAASLATPQVHFEVSDADDFLRRGDVPSAAKDGPHPGHQLAG